MQTIKPSTERFYKEVTAVALEKGYAIQLDGKTAHTSLKKPLCVPSQALAEAISVEWQAQGEKIDPTTMPLTALATTAIDYISPNPKVIVDALLEYGETDQACYRVDRPEALCKLQSEGFDPLLAWAESTFHVKHYITSSVLPVAQPPENRAQYEKTISTFDPFRLAALSSLVHISASLILGLALCEQQIDVAKASRLAFLEEEFQAGEWGEDEEAKERLKKLEIDIAAATQFLLLR